MKTNKKNKQKSVRIFGENNNILYEGRLTMLPVDESYIIQNSIRYFNDPDPCFIHRSAVLNRLFFEFEEYISANNLAESKFKIKNLPDRILGLFQIAQEANEVFYYEEE